MQNKNKSGKHLVLTAAALLAAASVLGACGGAGTPAQVDSTKDGSNNFAETAAAAQAPDETFSLAAGRLTFEIPGYYKLGNESNNGESASKEYNYYLDDADRAALQIATYTPENRKAVTKADLESYKKGLIDGLNKQDNMEFTLTKSQEGTYKDMPGYSFDFDGTFMNYPAHLDLDIFMDNSGQTQPTLYSFLFMTMGTLDRDVSGDYVSMMKNAVVSDPSAAASLPDQTTAASETETGSEPQTEAPETQTETAAPEDSGVDPDLKSALDHYEQLMNDYCDFMEKYKNAGSSDLAAMLDDYTKTLKEYSEAMDELNAIDTSSLSTADMEYYLDVTNRVSKRLLEVSP